MEHQCGCKIKSDPEGADLKYADSIELDRSECVIAKHYTPDPNVMEFANLLESCGERCEHLEKLRSEHLKVIHALEGQNASLTAERDECNKSREVLMRQNGEIGGEILSVKLERDSLRRQLEAGNAVLNRIGEIVPDSIYFPANKINWMLREYRERLKSL